MSRNRIEMNPDKTQVIWVGTCQQLAKVNCSELTQSGAVIQFLPTESDLGMLVDNQLTMADHVSSVCCSLYFQLRQLRQFVQNAAACLLTHTRKLDHITPVLRDWHWLPVWQCIVFKVAILVFKCLHGLALAYLTEYCCLVSGVLGRQHLRSSDSGVLYVPRTKTASGGRSFAVHDPATWNSLPVDLRPPWTVF